MSEHKIIFKQLILFMKNKQYTKIKKENILKTRNKSCKVIENLVKCNHGIL